MQQTNSEAPLLNALLQFRTLFRVHCMFGSGSHSGVDRLHMSCVIRLCIRTRELLSDKLWS